MKSCYLHKEVVVGHESDFCPLCEAEKKILELEIQLKGASGVKPKPVESPPAGATRTK